MLHAKIITATSYSTFEREVNRALEEIQNTSTPIERGRLWWTVKSIQYAHVRREGSSEYSALITYEDGKLGE